ncbi:MAG: hypothetical protein ACHQAV_04980 [Solirubrobacterales bacterium]
MAKKGGAATTACGELELHAGGYSPQSPLWHDRSPDGDSPVLVAGRDLAARAEVLDSLVATMPERTLFQEVGTFWEVLVRAPLVRMVVLSGELDGIPTESLLHMLGHRHPELPVVSLDASDRRASDRSTPPRDA